jgi:hypothetical protein
MKIPIGLETRVTFARLSFKCVSFILPPKRALSLGSPRPLLRALFIHKTLRINLKKFYSDALESTHQKTPKPRKQKPDKPPTAQKFLLNNH